MNKDNTVTATPDTEAHIVGERLAQLRRARRIRQAEAAKAAGLSRPTVSRIEAGDSGRTLDQVLRYLHVLSPGTTLLQLLQTPDDQAAKAVKRVRIPNQEPAAVAA